MQCSARGGVALRSVGGSCTRAHIKMAVHIAIWAGCFSGDAAGIQPAKAASTAVELVRPGGTHPLAEAREAQTRNPPVDPREGFGGCLPVGHDDAVIRKCKVSRAAHTRECVRITTTHAGHPDCAATAGREATDEQVVQHAASVVTHSIRWGG